MIRPSPRYFNLIIEEAPAMKDLGGLKETHEKIAVSCHWPGSWFEMFLFPVQDQGATGLIIQENHGITDANSHANFMEDIYLALKGDEQQIPVRIPYQYFGNMRCTHQRSLVAEESNNWDVCTIDILGGFDMICSR